VRLGPPSVLSLSMMDSPYLKLRCITKRNQITPTITVTAP
jgi:hypothetical protein